MTSENTSKTAKEAKGITVEVKVTRNGVAKTYQFKDAGESKAGTFKTFSPMGKNADLPEFAKIYVAVKPIK